MKIALTEHEGCFAFECEAESVADASLLARLGLQAEKVETQFYKEKVAACLVLKKPAHRRRDTVRRSK